MEGEYGVPTAPIVTARFAEYVIRDGHSHGMNLRWTFPPYPVAWVSRETLRQYVQGNDPVTGVKLTTEIIDALTKPLTEAEKNPEITPKAQKAARAGRRTPRQIAAVISEERVDRRFAHCAADRRKSR